MLDGKLEIEPVTIQDAGWYICIKKGFERILMAEAKLNVNDTISSITRNISIYTS